MQRFLWILFILLAACQPTTLPVEVQGRVQVLKAGESVISPGGYNIVAVFAPMDQATAVYLEGRERLVPFIEFGTSSSAELVVIDSSGEVVVFWLSPEEGDGDWSSLIPDVVETLSVEYPFPCIWTEVFSTSFMHAFGKEHAIEFAQEWMRHSRCMSLPTVLKGG